jgi:hypothetical protein
MKIHGSNNTKFLKTQQTKFIYTYKNIQVKLQEPTQPYGIIRYGAYISFNINYSSSASVDIC